MLNKERDVQGSDTCLRQQATEGDSSITDGN